MLSMHLPRDSGYYGRSLFIYTFAKGVYEMNKNEVEFIQLVFLLSGVSQLENWLSCLKLFCYLDVSAQCSQRSLWNIAFI